MLPAQIWAFLSCQAGPALYVNQGTANMYFHPATFSGQGRLQRTFSLEINQAGKTGNITLDSFKRSSSSEEGRKTNN